jgi:formylglycine-generating enzyme required for sulfatase activity
VVELEGLQRVEVSPLDEARIRTFLHNYLGETAGERLFRAMVGEEPPALLALGRNPYLLLMTTQVYVGSGERLPANRARLFADFVDTLLAREKERHPERWLPAERQVDALAALAYAMQVEGGRGTTVERPWAANLLRQAVPELDAEQLLYLATSATLLDADEASSRFYHQLLQEFFAARELGRRFAAGQAMSRYWPGGHWWEPSGWEETTILLAGLEPDASKLLAELSSANPVVAARCLVEGDAQVDEGTRAYIIGALIDSMTDAQTPPVARAQAGDALALVGDPRPGVMTMEGMPFCYVPPGPFWMGEGEAEHLNKELDYSYWMARYPVTNAQFQAFVDAGGYQERAHWPEAEEAGFWQGGLFKGRYDKEARDGPVEYGDPFSLSNHPVVGVTWYEALAYYRWLAGCLRKGGHLAEGRTVSLPSGAEWEKAARGGLEVPEQPIITLAGERGDVPLRKSPHPKQVYPWGDETAPNRANYRETGIGTTSAVGCFPGGASPYGVEELSGNVWEWTRSVYKSYPYDPKDGRESLRAGFDAPRVLHGGSFSNIQWIVRCAFRSGNDPDFRNGYYGFRLCVAARQE